MHRDLLKYLVLLTVVRALCIAATPAPNPWRRSRRQPDGEFHTRSVPEPHDVTAPRRHTAADGGGQPGSPRRAAAPPSPSEPDGGTHPGRRTRRGRKSRRRGSRGGQRWRACARGRDDICIASININAISQKILPLQHYLYRSQTDVCLIQETWLKASVPQRFTTFPGYNVVRVDRSGRTGGGVAILVRDSFTLSRLPRPGVVNTASKLESVWVRVSVARHKAILFASLYRPPSAPGTQLTADLEQLESELELMLSRHRGLVVICADANCDMRYVTGNTTGAHLSSLLQTYNLSQIIDSPTFRGSGSIIDIIATNDRASVLAQGVQFCHFSPHDFTRALFHVRKCRPEPITRVGRNWKTIDMESFCTDMANRDWSPVFETDNVAVQSDYFIQNMTDALDSHAPVRRVRMRNPRPPPLSQDTKRLMAERRAALRGPDRDLYADLNRRVRSAMQRDARASIERQIAEAGRGSMYRCIRPIMQGKTGSGQQQPDTDPDTLNRYFASIGVTTAASVAAGLPAGDGCPCACRGWARLRSGCSR